MSTYVYKVYSDFHTFARDVYSFTYGRDFKVRCFFSFHSAEVERSRLKMASVPVSPIKFNRLTWDVKNGDETKTENAALALFNS